MGTKNLKSLRLTLDVTYNLNGEPITNPRVMLRDMVKNAFAEGLLTGSTAAEIDDFEINVQEIDPDAISEVVDALKTGAEADIWYDAAYYHDVGASETIEKTQLAMQNAVEMLTNGGLAISHENTLDPDQQFETIADAIKLILSQDNPLKALKAFVCANLDNGEFGCASDLILAYPDML